jgi:hypothetical protein
MMESSTCDYGKINAWELCTQLEGSGMEMSPSDVDYFLHLFFSRSSRWVEIEETNSSGNWVVLRLSGPPGRGRRLIARLNLSRTDLLHYLPEEKDRDAFADQLWELSYNEVDSAKACKALSLRTSNRF